MITITITKMNQILVIHKYIKINKKYHGIRHIYAMEWNQKRYKVMFVFDLAYAVFSISLFCSHS